MRGSDLAQRKEMDERILQRSRPGSHRAAKFVLTPDQGAHLVPFRELE